MFIWSALILDQSSEYFDCRNIQNYVLRWIYEYCHTDENTSSKHTNTAGNRFALKVMELYKKIRDFVAVISSSCSRFVLII